MGSAPRPQVSDHYDVIILGAGIAGLTSALTLVDEATRHGTPRPGILILEGDSRPGGRAKTVRLHGTPVDTGAHWFHGGYDNAFFQWLAARYGIPDDINMDELQESVLTLAGGRYGPEDRRRIDAELKTTFDAYMQAHPGATPSLADIFRQSRVNDTIASYGVYMAQCWAGVDSTDQISAAAYYDSREATPGGIQLRDGLEVIVTNMAGELARHGVAIKCRTSVASVSQTARGVTLTDLAHATYRATHTVITASVGVLQSQSLAFDPPLAPHILAYLSAVQAAHVTKIVIPVTDEFFRTRGIPEESRYGGVDQDGGYFCFAHGAAEPLIVLFVGGTLATDIEHMAPDDVQQFAFDKLDTIDALDGYRQAVTGHHLVTRWNSHPLHRCTYSAMKPGHGQRQGPLTDGHITLAGEAFISSDAATLTGAWRSGQRAGMEIYARLTQTAGHGPTGPEPATASCDGPPPRRANDTRRHGPAV